MPPSDQPKVRDLFQIPERIGRMDFTVALADGIARPDETVTAYVLTEDLVRGFDQALGLIDTARRKGQSQATYLHGSFGSGKSHFMAILSLLLADHEGAWSRPELHPLRVKYPWVGEAKVLELHVHMLNQPDVETPIFRAYLRYLREHHPDADLPALFADQHLFEDAERLLGVLGEAKFFGPMNNLGGGESGDGEKSGNDRLGRGWGKVKPAAGRASRRSGGWDRARFDAAIASHEPERRAELLSALTRTHFQAFADASPSFVDIDRGLGILSRHAKALGYDVIVLLLDELILWLSYMARDPARLGAMVQRMVKLVEATDNDRPAPLCSFIARQRQLREMVGEELAGPDDAHLADVLEHARGRFGQIALGDNNLPAIVEKRVLRPRDEAARALLRQTFERLRAESEQKGSWTTLLGTGHDAEAFRRVYPFSPVLIDALVALSNALQRQRTSIKLLTELLIGHIDDVRLGQLVGIGDLFDVMAEGEKATEGAMGARFDAARRLYKHDLLPLIQETNNTQSPAECQRMRPEHPPDRGCAGCTQVTCRSDNRVIKTLLTAALVPGVPAFRDLSARRVIELNHGHLSTKIPGREATVLVAKLRKWASQIGQIRLGDQSDPQVTIQLEGVDVRPLLEQAREIDSASRRRRVLYTILFQALTDDDAKGELQGDLLRRHEWRGTKRPGSIRFDNVRRMSPELLRCPEDQDWRLIIDHPFDEGAHGPHDDERVIREFMAEGAGSWTLVWLPSFFSDASNRTLSELVRIEHILSSSTTLQQFIGHLSVEQQEQARTTLENLASQKRQHLLGVLAKAYGLVHGVKEDDPDLDPARRVDQHLYLLRSGVSLGATLPGALGEAIGLYTSALLDARFPRHPRFGEPLTPARIDKILDRFQEIVEAPDHKIAGDRRELEELRGTLGELGLVRVTESTAHLRIDGPLQTIESRRRQRGIEHPRVDEVLRWVDENEQMGLQPEAQAVVVRAYALAESRTLVRGDRPFDPTKERGKGKGIPGDVILEQPDLPEQTEWRAALEVAGHAFGITQSRKALTGDNLRHFADAVATKAKAQAPAATRLPTAIAAWREALGIDEESARLRTATRASEVIAAIQGQPPAALARALAGFGSEEVLAGTSLQAIGSSLARAAANVGVLDESLVLGVFRQLAARRESLAGAAAILDEAAAVLRQDELQRTLATRLRQLADDGQALLGKTIIQEPPPPPPPPIDPPRGGADVIVQMARRARGSADLRDTAEALAALVDELREAADDDALEDLEFVVQLELRGRRR